MRAAGKSAKKKANDKAAKKGMARVHTHPKKVKKKTPNNNTPQPGTTTTPLCLGFQP